jgi:ABC-type nitrate/sulfonate/bicarbonate transport system substrate-binding protein
MNRKTMALMGATVSLVLTASACGEAGKTASSGEDTAKDPLTVRLNYTPWGMHNYLYAALDQGYFADEGIKVQTKPAQAGQSLQFVGTGKEEIGITDASAMLAAAHAGAPVVAIAMDHPYSPGAFFFLESSGIETAEDLVGKKVCFPVGSHIHDALVAGLEKQGIDIEKINFVSIAGGSEVSLVASGECDASEGFSYGQPLTLEGEGFEAGHISVSDLGLDLYGVVIFSNPRTIEERPESLTKFLNAVCKGQMWAYEHMNESTAKTLERTEGRTVENEVQKVQLIYDDYRASPEFDERWGLMSEEGWQSTISALTEMGTLENEIAPSEIFTNEIIEGAEACTEFSTMLNETEPTE